MEKSGIYLAYLLDVDRNAATFALHTECAWASTATAESELRIASILKGDLIAEALESMELAANIIRTWSDFYRWLGSGRSWAAWTEESGLKLLPHWLAETTEYECRKTPGETFKFFDRTCSIQPEALRGTRIHGISPEPGAGAVIASLISNLMVTTRPLFDIKADT